VEHTVPNPPTFKAIKLQNVNPGSRIHIQVKTASVTVRFGPSGAELDTPTPFGGNQGFALDSTAGLQELVWGDSEIWAAGIAANATPAVIDVSGGRLA
jgi:hypothetical protein